MNLFDFTVNKSDNTIMVTRKFAAEVALVWDAFTKPELLDEWWAPKPYHARTKTMDFRDGGFWLYAMVGPEGDEIYARADYSKIKPLHTYTAVDSFCDESGKVSDSFPNSTWHNTFVAEGDTTTVNIIISYVQLADLEKIIELGFQEGFTAALENLDQYIAAQYQLRKRLHTNTSRVCTYLNFPGNTEVAFLFYQSVFKTSFNGSGMQRFGELPADDSQPPIADSVKNMILHVELPITGNHVLMGTDAPKEMGFTVVVGNNMHISLEPDSRLEAKRLFDELSAGGNITMPLQEMFWGAYFGSFTDKFGINWMVNCAAK